MMVLPVYRQGMEPLIHLHSKWGIQSKSVAESIIAPSPFIARTRVIREGGAPFLWNSRGSCPAMLGHMTLPGPVNSVLETVSLVDPTRMICYLVKSFLGSHLLGGKNSAKRQYKQKFI